MEDEVVKEVRAVREAFAASHGYDIYAIMAAVRELTIANGWEVVRMPPRLVADQAVPVVPQTSLGVTQPMG